MFLVPQYAILKSSQEVSYLCNLKNDKDYNVKFVRDKKIIVIDLKISPSKLSDKPWVILGVKSINIQGQEVDVPICDHCNDCTQFLSHDQTHETLSRVICHHCKVASNIIRNFDNCWTLDGALSLAPDDDASDRVDIFHVKEGRSPKSQHLALG